METLSNCDALCEQFFDVFNVSQPQENDTLRPHPKYFRFNSKKSEDSIKRIQNERRKEFFERIAKRREKILNVLRPLEKLVEGDKETTSLALSDYTNAPNVSNDSIEDSSMLVDQTTISTACKKKRTCNKSKSIVKNQIMLSEWLVDVPEDFYTNWYMLCCPVGKRTLVISGNGKTKVFSRSGHLLFQLPWSMLDYTTRNKKRSRAVILDCIFVESERTFYMIDVLTWNGYDLHDCDTEFRFFWLKAKFNEDMQAFDGWDRSSANCESMEVTDSDGNSNCVARRPPRHRFVPLEYRDCTPQNIRTNSKWMHSYTVDTDGILFYLKNAPYVPGMSPLVLWLKVSMIPDILKISLEN